MKAPTPLQNREVSIVASCIDRWFLAHPRLAHQSYFEHLRFAWRVAAVLVRASAAAIVHGILPLAFQSTAGDCIRALHERLVTREGALTGLATPGNCR